MGQDVFPYAIGLFDGGARVTMVGMVGNRV